MNEDSLIVGKPGIASDLQEIMNSDLDMLILTSEDVKQVVGCMALKLDI